jgi:hypothetical protein
MLVSKWNTLLNFRACVAGGGVSFTGKMARKSGSIGPDTEW